MVLAGVIALASAGLVAAVFAPAPDEGPPPLAARVGRSSPTFHLPHWYKSRLACARTAVGSFVSG